uniref:restriction endonuclease subunit S n=2 Tax=Bacteria TaxID=2 RepID=UPI0026E50785
SNGLEKYPKLRFPGFEEPYRALCLGNIATSVNRTDPESMANIMMLSAGKGFIMQSDKYSRDNAGQSLKKYILLKKGELAYNHGASKAKQYGCCYELLEDEARIPYVYHCFKIDEKEFTPYVALELNNPKMDKQLKRLVSSSARMDGLLNISFDDYMSVRLTLPSYFEQMKIADFLNTIDRRIELQRALVESLKKYKRGVIQHIFHSSSGVGWSYVKLGNIFKKASRRNIDGKIKNVITNSAEYGLIPQRDFFDKNIAVDGNTLNYFVIKTGDFVYNPRKSNNAPYGPFNRYTLKDNGIISPLYTCLVLQADINPSYLAWYFKSDAWHRYIYDNGSQGVRHDRVSMTDDLLMGIPVAIPSADNQRKIARMLDTVETRLLAFQSEYALLEKVRKGFMQQLFI